jgi:DeoR/GlpR family transcriptional regulator of sugar metabolism
MAERQSQMGRDAAARAPREVRQTRFPVHQSSRRREIEQLVLQRGTVSIADLAKAFKVSPMTVHRDLAELEQLGVITRFRGGASAQPSGIFESSLRYRLSAMPEEKAALGLAAASLIRPGMSVLLDASTTTLAVVPHLAELAPLTVVTNQLEILQMTTVMEGVRVISLGGEYLRSENCFVGIQCVENLRSLHVDLAFMAVTAVAGGEVFDLGAEIILIKRAMMACCERSVLLVDHSKFRAKALLRLARLDEFGLVITDDGASDEKIDDLIGRGVDYLLAPVVGSPGR